MAPRESLRARGDGGRAGEGVRPCQAALHLPLTAASPRASLPATQDAAPRMPASVRTGGQGTLNFGRS